MVDHEIRLLRLENQCSANDQEIGTMYRWSGTRDFYAVMPKDNKGGKQWVYLEKSDDNEET